MTTHTDTIHIDYEENLMFTFEYDELIERLGFNTSTDQLVNAGLDNDSDIELLFYGKIIHAEDLPVTYGLKTGYIDQEEILLLLEEDHDSINLDDEEYEYEIAYVGTELSKQLVVVRVLKTFIEE